MYFRKCWRDLRVHFIVYVTVFAAVMFFIALTQVINYNSASGWSISLPQTPDDAERVTRGATRAIAPIGILIAILAGLGMGATGVGEEFRAGTLEFLLTRPRPRRYFIWMCWLASLAQLAVLAFVYAAVAVAALALLTGSFPGLRLLIVVPIVFTAAAVIHGIVYLLTTATRSGKNGQAFGLLIVIAYPLIALSLWRLAQIQLPTLWDLLPGSANDPAAALYTTAAFPTTTLLGWLAVPPVLTLAAQLIFERAEV